MAERPEHQQILETLAKMDADFLRQAECWFAGGTAISLRCHEFRISRDVDFLCSSRRGYRLLRERVHSDGVRALFRQDVDVRREIRADRYGVRLVLDVQGMPLKIEIVSEGRIELDGVEDPDLPVARLADQDLVAEKLLANEDRFRDDASLARDIVDLIVLEHELGELPAVAWDKARQAYGNSIDSAFARALEQLRSSSEQRAKIFKLLSMTDEAKNIVEAKIKEL